MRALIIVAAWILYYSAARYLALGQMVTIYFGSPILVALMAGPILGEHTGTPTDAPELQKRFRCTGDVVGRET